MPDLNILEQVLDHIHNWFEADRVEGEWTVADGTVLLPFLKEGQYFRVRGSVLNDGLWRYPAGNMADETFRGTISPLIVPRSLLELSVEIGEWQREHGSASSSPYQSESFGGYSYSKGGASSGDGGGSLTGWRAAFRDRLNVWRRLP